MANPQDNQHNQENQCGKDHHWTREDFATSVSANYANYCYQMSLWWWNAYMHNLNARIQPWASQFTDQSCECAERSLIEDDDCECCQNGDGTFESQRDQNMNPCKDCPQQYSGSPWQRLPEEYSSSSGNHHDLRLRQNNKSDKDNVKDNDSDNYYPDGDEDSNDHIDDNDEDDDFYANSNNTDDDDSDINMEVDDDFRKFLEQSEKHRQEREQSKLTSMKLFRAKSEQLWVSPSLICSHY